MNLPNFLIIGATKSGTTALHRYLKQHPQAYMSPLKETNFFAFKNQNVGFSGPGDEWTCENAITTQEAYEKQFAAVSEEKAIGEASPYYLHSPQAAENIRCHIPDAKLIAILRNPVDRAFSSYLHLVRDGRENLTFEEGLLAEEERVAQGWEWIWHYRQAGLYAAQVKRFLDLFPHEQTRFYLYDDLVSDPTGFLRHVYEFLDINADFTADLSVKPNATGVPRNRLLGRFLFQPNPLKTAVKLLMPKQARYNLGQKMKRRMVTKPTLSKKTYSKLLSSYEEDVSDLQDLIGRDLSSWTGKRPLPVSRVIV